MSKEHKEKALREITFKIIVVSSSRYEKKLKGERIEDKSGELAIKLIGQYGYRIQSKIIIPDDKDAINSEIDKAEKEADAIILIGGTGIGVEDYTYEVVKEKVEKEITGFGEIFRFLSYREIGSSAILSRAYAGIRHRKLIACIPGSTKAVKLALEKLILPEVGHILLHARKG